MVDIAPSSLPIQQESVQFNNPVSEASAGAMGAAINYLLRFQQSVGSITASMLTEPQFQASLGNPTPATWILADGRDVTGSQYQALTGQTNAPDLRGMFLRGLNNGGSAAGTRSDGNQNPDDPLGHFAPGTYSPDKFASHTHNEPLYGPNSADNGAQAGNGTDLRFGGHQTGPTGGNETAPKNVSINWFIRIN